MSGIILISVADQHWKIECWSKEQPKLRVRDEKALMGATVGIRGDRGPGPIYPELSSYVSHDKGRQPTIALSLLLIPT